MIGSKSSAVHIYYTMRILDRAAISHLSRAALSATVGIPFGLPNQAAEGGGDARHIRTPHYNAWDLSHLALATVIFI